jgi:hypothetical protein
MLCDMVNISYNYGNSNYGYGNYIFTFGKKLYMVMIWLTYHSLMVTVTTDMVIMYLHWVKSSLIWYNIT